MITTSGWMLAHRDGTNAQPRNWSTAETEAERDAELLLSGQTRGDTFVWWPAEILLCEEAWFLANSLTNNDR